MKRTSTRPTRRDKLLRAGAVAFWLLIWQLGSMAVDQEILLVSPVSACVTLLRMMGEASFYRAVFGSFGRILAGFALSMLLAVLLASLSRAFEFVRVLLRPLLSTIKATPVASIVILALIWISSKNLSIFISFLMVLPIAYENVLEGLDSADAKLLEMARVFRIPFWGQVRAIYAPAAFPMLLTAVRVSLGMCWKAGIAAEVIAQPKNSIGSALQQAKLFFATPEMFAWTLAIILLSVALERLVILLINALRRRMEAEPCSRSEA